MAGTKDIPALTVNALINATIRRDVPIIGQRSINIGNDINSGQGYLMAESELSDAEQILALRGTLAASGNVSIDFRDSVTLFDAWGDELIDAEKVIAILIANTSNAPKAIDYGDPDPGATESDIVVTGKILDYAYHDGTALDGFTLNPGGLWLHANNIAINSDSDDTIVLTNQSGVDAAYYEVIAVTQIDT